MVIWLLGISGAGKTTLGKQLKQYFNNKEIKSCIIDGDIVRDFYDNDLGYSKEDRIANIKRIMLSAYLLEQNGIVPIVCNISPFEFLREFARNKFDNYIEVYLKRDIQTITNKKSVYSDTNVVGVDMQFEEPKKPTIIINTSNDTIDKSLEKIIKVIDANK